MAGVRGWAMVHLGKRPHQSVLSACRRELHEGVGAVREPLPSVWCASQGDCFMAEEPRECRDESCEIAEQLLSE